MNTNTNNGRDEKVFHWGEAPVTDKSNGARDFHQTYGFSPLSIFRHEAGENVAVPAYRYTFWNDSRRLPIYDKSGELVTNLNERAEWLRAMLFGTDILSWDEYRFTEYPVGIVGKEEYDKGSNVIHPTAVEWVYMGSTNIDMKDQELPDYKPCYISINSPSNRYNLWKIMMKEHRLPRLVDFNPMGKEWKGGIYQPFNGFLLMEGLKEGTVQKIENKPRQRRF